jgi:hypothetical protein
MHPVLICVLLGVLLLVSPFMWWRGWKAGARAELESAKTEVVAAHVKLHEARQVAEHCRLQWEEWERKAKGYQGINSGILTERDNWQHLYFDQAVGHGNAQAMMMSTIDYLAGRLRGLGVEVPLPAALSQVQQEFTRQHVTPVLAQSAPKLSPASQVAEDVQPKEGAVG